MSGDDANFMRRAIALAGAHVGLTADNPSVGCVIVMDGQVVGEGVTGPGGRPHAEEQALIQAGDAARGATAYVTLEPCAERSSGGASCSELLTTAGLARVVAAVSDRSTFAGGRGGQRLRAGGTTFDLGLLKDEAAALYAGYKPATKDPPKR